MTGVWVAAWVVLAVLVGGLALTSVEPLRLLLAVVLAWSGGWVSAELARRRHV